jgi:hypothetical protein
MSRNRRDQDFRRLGDARAADIRRGGEGAVEPVGYSPGGGSRTKAIPGDEKFPFFKDVPDVVGPYRAIELAELLADVVQNPLPQVAAEGDLLALDPIDVRGIRLLTTFVEYYGDGGELILVPDGLTYEPEDGATGTGQELWYPIGVIDPTLTTVGAVLVGGGFRRFYATELRMDGTALTPAAAARATLVFDVAPYREIRFRVGDTVATAGLNLLYSLER